MILSSNILKMVSGQFILYSDISILQWIFNSILIRGKSRQLFKDADTPVMIKNRILFSEGKDGIDFHMGRVVIWFPCCKMPVNKLVSLLEYSAAVNYMRIPIS